jgi:hypothetical protein
MKKNIGQLTSEIFAILDGQEKEDCIKVLFSVSTLIGITAPNPSRNSEEESGQLPRAQRNLKAAHTTNAKAYFDEKAPKTKGEEFAVAAKFRSENGLGDNHTKEDLKNIIKTQAKRTFNESNFARDIDNAIRHAKFFMKDDGKGQYMLSNVGEKYVDALPDRATARATRTTKGGKKNRKPKKSSVKKSNK